MSGSGVPQVLQVRYTPLVEALAVARVITPPSRVEMLPYWVVYL